MDDRKASKSTSLLSCVFFVPVCTLQKGIPNKALEAMKHLSVDTASIGVAPCAMHPSTAFAASARKEMLLLTIFAASVRKSMLLVAIFVRLLHAKERSD